MRLALPLRRARLQLIADLADGAATPAKLEFYSGSRPAEPGGTPTTLQCEIILDDPCAALDPTDSILIFTDGLEGVRIDDETITWARLVDGDGDFVADGTVTLPDAIPAGDFLIDNTAGVIGAIIRLEAGAIGE